MHELGVEGSNILAEMCLKIFMLPGGGITGATSVQ